MEEKQQPEFVLLCQRSDKIMSVQVSKLKVFHFIKRYFTRVLFQKSS